MTWWQFSHDKNRDKSTIYRVSIKSFPDHKHLSQENYVEYKLFFSKCNSTQEVSNLSNLSNGKKKYICIPRSFLVINVIRERLYAHPVQRSLCICKSSIQWSKNKPFLLSVKWTVTTKEWSNLKLHSFLTSALDRGGRFDAPQPLHPRGKSPQRPLNGRLNGPAAGIEVVKWTKSLSPARDRIAILQLPSLQSTIPASQS